MTARRPVVGAVAGVVATGAMSAWQAAGQLSGPYGEQPPKRLVRTAARRLGLPARRHGPVTWPVTAAAHLGFGAACGAVYATVVSRSTVGYGSAFGLAVWAVSYPGWIPAVGVLPPPHRDNPRRAWTMLIGHVVYGAVLGALVRRWSPSTSAPERLSPSTAGSCP
jgi:uncharacterized membrane protein YagU involved in acid resistance